MSTKCPSLNFPHEHGLGVLFWGSEFSETAKDNATITQLISLLKIDGVKDLVIAAFMLAGEDSVRRHIFGHVDDIPMEHVPELMADYIAQLSKAHTDQAILNSQILELNEHIEVLSKRISEEQDYIKELSLSLSLAQESLLRAKESEAWQQQWISDMDARLQRAHRRPWKLVRALIAYRILKLLSRASPPLPQRTADRLARSAQKRNPKRSHLPNVISSHHVPPAQKATLAEIREDIQGTLELQLKEFLASSEKIILPTSKNPNVTVILVLWNQAHLTLACLRSIAKETSVSLEIIIVDNASTDSTPELLQRIQNARILRMDENIGFLYGVNSALAEVQNGHVLLLNNDATLKPDTLISAVRAIESDENIGAVGGPIVLPNGVLQEAGSIIWRDGSTQGYGREDDPNNGCYKFRREVDYCSGAFLLIREGLFQKLGGFDTDYAPAYYEETDLCMRIREAGYRVVYEPRAAIDHFEFGSSTEVSKAIDLQIKNREVFRSKHARTLAEHHLPASSDNILIARMRNAARRILYIEDRVPFVNMGAGLPRANEILRLMTDMNFFITFLPATHLNDDWSATWKAIPDNVEVVMNVGLSGLEDFLAERMGYYEQIFVSRPHNMAKLVEIITKRPHLVKNTRVIYDAEAIFASRDLCKAKLFNDSDLQRRALREEREELSLAVHAHYVTAVSESEAERFRSLNGPNVFVLGHALDTDPTPNEFDDRENILFVGNLAHKDSPNVDSYEWFVEEVLPNLDIFVHSEVKFLVAGQNDAIAQSSLSNERINLLGNVSHLRELFNQCRVFVAPTRYAAGIPHKVHQAAAFGVPVVATSLLAKQLGWKDNDHLLVADTPKDFAEAIERLYNDLELWKKIRFNALEKVKVECSPALFRTQLSQVVRR